MKGRVAAGLLLVLLGAGEPASARVRLPAHAQAQAHVYHTAYRRPSPAAAPVDFFSSLFGKPSPAGGVRVRHLSHTHAVPRVARYARPSSAVIGSRPPGCPRAYCGCGASIFTFHRIVPRLNLAAAWLSFPRALPAPGNAAVRQHHVMILEEPGSAPSLWIVHDGNSGGHLTRRHEVSLRGYVVVNPREPAR